MELSLYLVTDARLCANLGLIETVLAAVRGGVGAVQLRDKQASDAELIEQGLQLRQALRGTGVGLIVNDRIEVARAIGADGVHLGQSDQDVGRARAILGPKALIGLSVQTEALAKAVDPAQVNYVGIGPIRATSTKPDHGAPLGIKGFARVRAACRVPSVAIGGIKLEQVGPLIDAGADGIALVSAICAVEDPEAAAHDFADAIDRRRHGDCAA